MKVHATIPVYNDHVFLPATLASLKGCVDHVVIADGAYQLYYENYLKHDPNAKPWSTDGSLEILDAIPNLPDITLIRCPDDKPWINQCVKRTAMVDAVPVGDWFIVIDTDEVLYGDVERGLKEIFDSGCIAASVPLYNAGLDVSRLRPFWHPRIFKKLEGMHYYRKHWLLSDRYGRKISNYPIKWTDAFVFAHLKTFKERGRLEPHMGYMRMMSIDGWMEPQAQHFGMS